MKFLRHQLEKRFWLRWHMFLILAATIASGFAVNVALHHLLQVGMALRYPLSVVASYGVFFLIMRGWLSYIRSQYQPEPAIDHAEDEVGEAGMDFDVPKKLIEGGSSVMDEPWGCVIVLSLTAVVSVAWWGVLAVTNAPLILADVLFQFLLAAGLIRPARRVEAEDWKQSLFGATFLPFVTAFIVAAAAGLVLQAIKPDATSLGEALHSRTVGKPVPVSNPMAEKPEP